jgi:ABC-type polysaccharide/polyol phosphate transport system ATPase subunit
VLAVGDAAFQKKCLGKMGDVAKEGRTVLFVSHTGDLFSEENCGIMPLERESRFAHDPKGGGEWLFRN